MLFIYLFIYFKIPVLKEELCAKVLLFDSILGGIVLGGGLVFYLFFRL